MENMWIECGKCCSHRRLDFDAREKINQKNRIWGQGGSWRTDRNVLAGYFAILSFSYIRASLCRGCSTGDVPKGSALYGCP